MVYISFCWWVGILCGNRGSSSNSSGSTNSDGNKKYHWSLVKNLILCVISLVIMHNY